MLVVVGGKKQVLNSNEFIIFRGDRRMTRALDDMLSTLNHSNIGLV
jgi:hypothetical protein